MYGWGLDFRVCGDKLLVIRGHRDASVENI